MVAGGWLLFPTITANPRPVTPPELAPADVLPLLLTTESLMFAALGIAVTRSAGRGEKRLPVRTIAVLLSLILSLIAFGAGEAWWELFGHGQIDGFVDGAEGIALMGGIAGQPIVAWIITAKLF